MARFIKDPTGLTFGDLQNNDWDLIELNITVDIAAAMEWVNEVQIKNQDCIWAWSDADPYVDEEKLEYFIKTREDQLIRTQTEQPEQWMLQWSYQRAGVLPFKGVASKKLYPEVCQPDFDSKWNQPLEKFMFGFWKRYYDLLGPDVFEVARLVRFPKGCGLRTHKDTGAGQPFLIRMHTVPSIGPDHFFNYDSDLTDITRQYKLEAGKTYLLNTGILHAAWNNDDQDWWMLHNNPTPEAITKLLNTRMHIE
jgi:hypothetical protein